MMGSNIWVVIPDQIIQDIRSSQKWETDDERDDCFTIHIENTCIKLIVWR